MREWRPGPAWIFCPADRPERYAKALAMADVVILDLEDAVSPQHKAEARDYIRTLAYSGDLDLDRTVLRINAADSGEQGGDLEVAAVAGIRVVMLAKAEESRQIEALPHDVIALIETPRGVEQAGTLAASTNVVAMMWGADDLVAGLGGVSSRRADGTYRGVAWYARHRVLIAAKAHDRLALDGVHMDIPDLDGLAEECEDAVAIGFDASVAIHPSQVPVIRATYRPSPERVSWARRLLTHAGQTRGVTIFEGRMVDGPIYQQAERLLHLETSTTAKDREHE